MSCKSSLSGSVFANSFLPGLGQGFWLGGSFDLTSVKVACVSGCGADGLGSPSSGGCGEMAGAVLSSSMGVGLALMAGGGGAKE